MKKLFWFGVGVLLVLFAALASAGARDATVRQVMYAFDKGDETAAAFVVGLTTGAYVSYVNQLTDAGFDTSAALKIAEHDCGDLSAQTVLFEAYAKEKLRDLPAAQILPTVVWMICHRGEKGS